MGYGEEAGFGTVIARGAAAAEGRPAELVYLGFSLGVLPAQRLAQTHPGVKGALLLEACVPVAEFGDAWPHDVPVQVHGMDADPFFAGEGDVDAARALVETAADAELFLPRRQAPVHRQQPAVVRRTHHNAGHRASAGLPRPHRIARHSSEDYQGRSQPGPTLRGSSRSGLWCRTSLRLTSRPNGQQTVPSTRTHSFLKCSIRRE